MYKSLCYKTERNWRHTSLDHCACNHSHFRFLSMPFHRALILYMLMLERFVDCGFILHEHYTGKNVIRYGNQRERDEQVH